MQFNPVLKLQYTKYTKVVALADYLPIMITADSVGRQKILPMSN